MSYWGVQELKRVLDLSGAECCYAAIAVKELLFARLRHAFLPTKTILMELQMPARRATGPQRCEHESTLGLVSWAIGAAAARVPWRSDCLLRVMAADRWLRRMGFQPEFHLGVGKDSAGQFQAHAWLRCNEISIAGGNGDDYLPLRIGQRYFSQRREEE